MSAGSFFPARFVPPLAATLGERGTKKKSESRPRRSERQLHEALAYLRKIDRND